MTENDHSFLAKQQVTQLKRCRWQRWSLLTSTRTQKKARVLDVVALFRAGVLLFLWILIVGCSGSNDDKVSMASINGYNSTHQGIGPFYVKKAGGTGINAYGDGGIVCCILYPKKWRPGLTVKVTWATSSGKSGGDPTKTWHEAEVPIERYEEPGSMMNVHFLPEGRVRILISNANPRSESYPGPEYPVTPPGWSPKGTDDDDADLAATPVPAEIQ